MYLLAIDAATNRGGVALGRNRETVAMLVLRTPSGYSDCLIDSIDFLLRQRGLNVNQIEGLAVSTGPGSFTGVRIGLATVKAWGQALNVPAVGISTLEGLAYRFRHFGTDLGVLIDARRQQVYAACYRISEGRPECLMPEVVQDPASWIRELPRGDWTLVGDGAWRYREILMAASRQVRVVQTDNRLLEQLCTLGYDHLAAGLGVPVAKLCANYIRPSDAQRGRPVRPKTG